MSYLVSLPPLARGLDNDQNYAGLEHEQSRLQTRSLSRTVHEGFMRVQPTNGSIQHEVSESWNSVLHE